MLQKNPSMVISYTLFTSQPQQLLRPIRADPVHTKVSFYCRLHCAPRWSLRQTHHSKQLSKLHPPVPGIVQARKEKMRWTYQRNKQTNTGQKTRCRVSEVARTVGMERLSASWYTSSTAASGILNSRAHSFLSVPTVIVDGKRCCFGCAFARADDTAMDRSVTVTIPREDATLAPPPVRKEAGNPVNTPTSTRKKIHQERTAPAGLQAK